MDAVFATRRIGTDAVFARLFFSATDANAPGGTGTSTGSGSGGAASGEGGFSGSISDADIARIAAAVLAALQTSPVPFPANVKKVNDLTVVGRGLAPPNHWRPE